MADATTLDTASKVACDLSAAACARRASTAAASLPPCSTSPAPQFCSAELSMATRHCSCATAALDWFLPTLGASSARCSRRRSSAGRVSSLSPAPGSAHTYAETMTPTSALAPASGERVRRCTKRPAAARSGGARRPMRSSVKGRNMQLLLRRKEAVSFASEPTPSPRGTCVSRCSTSAPTLSRYSSSHTDQRMSSGPSSESSPPTLETTTVKYRNAAVAFRVSLMSRPGRRASIAAARKPGASTGTASPSTPGGAASMGLTHSHSVPTALTSWCVAVAVASAASRRCATSGSTSEGATNARSPAAVAATSARLSSLENCALLTARISARTKPRSCAGSGAPPHAPSPWWRCSASRRSMYCARLRSSEPSVSDHDPPLLGW
mmetsp:Transcript_21912/g.74481  ORF Transcript_21912/g.74481 Transcript_21912/m.74481 type:complete len:381 (-) Transcript_21912:962-2104(-)